MRVLRRMRCARRERFCVERLKRMVTFMPRLLIEHGEEERREEFDRRCVARCDSLADSADSAHRFLLQPLYRRH